MSQWVNGNRDRIFINTAVGCSAKCVYCYLPELGMDKIQHMDVGSILNELDSLTYFIPGRQGTILSIGCYSECWAEDNREQTIDLIEGIVTKGNYIQLATKKEISERELVYLNSISLFEKQIGIYISVPTLSQYQIYEPGTDSIERRLSFLSYKQRFDNLYFTIYIKPIIRNVTIKDISYYKKILGNRDDIYCVVGAMLKPGLGSSYICIGIHEFKEIPNNDQDILIKELSEVCQVYKHSTDLVNIIRRGI